MIEDKSYILFELPEHLQQVVIKTKNQNSENKLDNYAAIDLLTTKPDQFGIGRIDVEKLKNIVKTCPHVCLKKK